MAVPATPVTSVIGEVTFWGLNEVEALLLTGALAAVVAIWTIFSARGIAARQATLDFIRKSQDDKELFEAKKEFNRLAGLPGGLAPYAYRAAWKSEASRTIQKVLNERELIAVAIERGMLDDVVYRRWDKTGYIDDYETAAPFIAVLRHELDNGIIYYEFEQIALWFRGGKKAPRRWLFWRKFV